MSSKPLGRKSRCSPMGSGERGGTSWRRKEQKKKKEKRKDECNSTRYHRRLAASHSKNSTDQGTTNNVPGRRPRRQIFRETDACAGKVEQTPAKFYSSIAYGTSWVQKRNAALHELGKEERERLGGQGPQRKVKIEKGALRRKKLRLRTRRSARDTVPGKKPRSTRLACSGFR